MRKIVGIKDDNGIFTREEAKEKASPEPTDKKDHSIDDLLRAGLQNIAGAMRAVSQDIGTGAPSRETIQNLKDLMSMLKELKKEEKELLDNMTEAELNDLIS